MTRTRQFRAVIAIIKKLSLYKNESAENAVKSVGWWSGRKKEIIKCDNKALMPFIDDSSQCRWCRSQMKYKFILLLWKWLISRLRFLDLRFFCIQADADDSLSCTTSIAFFTFSIQTLRRKVKFCKIPSTFQDSCARVPVVCTPFHCRQDEEEADEKLWILFKKSLHPPSPPISSFSFFISREIRNAQIEKTKETKNWNNNKNIRKLHLSMSLRK